VGRRLGEGEAGARDDDVQRHRDVRRDGHVVDAEQIEAGEETAEYRAGDVAAVEEPEPGDALRRCLDPARDRRESRAHQQRRGQEADHAEDAAQQQPAEARSADGGVQPAGVRKPIEDQ
jgi:hypothetical protein